MSRLVLIHCKYILSKLCGFFYRNYTINKLLKLHVIIFSHLILSPELITKRENIASYIKIKQLKRQGQGGNFEDNKRIVICHLKKKGSLISLENSLPETLVARR